MRPKIERPNLSVRNFNVLNTKYRSDTKWIIDVNATSPFLLKHFLSKYVSKQKWKKCNSFVSDLYYY